MISCASPISGTVTQEGQGPLAARIDTLEFKPIFPDLGLPNDLDST